MSTYEISKSSLLSLKAEILRKQQELSKAKAENDVKIRNLKKNSPLDLKNKGVEQRQTQDLSEEEENLLKKSRDALEAKSKLYDKLSKGTSLLTQAQEEYCRRYLVRFDKKSRVPDLPPEFSEDDIDRYPSSDEDVRHNNYEAAKNRDEEWVEYVDCLGRTRTCLRKDLEYLKSKDRDLEQIVEEKRRNRGRSRSPEPPKRPSPEPEPKPAEDPEINEENELLSSDMRREILRKQWEKEEEELRNKSDIHYQDILFNEARTHGVGYYGFSKDEDVRARQQEALKKLRQETKNQQRKAQDLRAMREKQLAARVRAATNRKRERMGLPPLEDEPEPPPPPPEPQPESDKNKKVVDDTEKEKEAKRKKHVRPWDLGKEGVKKKEHYEYSQKEWVDKKRKERETEFAPPSTYRRGFRSREIEEEMKFERKETKPTPIRNELSDSDDSDESSVGGRGGATVPPPPTYDYYGPGGAKRVRKAEQQTNNMSDSIEAGLKFLREQLEKKQSRQDMF